VLLLFGTLRLPIWLLLLPARLAEPPPEARLDTLGEAARFAAPPEARLLTDGLPARAAPPAARLPAEAPPRVEPPYLLAVFWLG
jgi:hypothetical protein